jgi:penicillin-binding protein 2
MYSAIVNRGKIYRPHVLKEIRSAATKRVIRKVVPELVREIPISKKSYETVLSGMRAVVERGTAGFLNQRIFPPIAGKTGTAQTRSGVKGSNHAWFAGVAPYGAPPEEQTVVVVFLEYGMGGAATAAPVAGDVFRTLYPDYHMRLEQKRIQSLKENSPGAAPHVDAPSIAPQEKGEP